MAQIDFRVGTGFDAHALVPGRQLVLGGVHIPHGQGLAGHSDGDVLLHAVMDALLGAAGLGDIGVQFPSGDARYKDISSLLLLSRVKDLVQAGGWRISNVDATMVAQTPRLGPFVEAMRKQMASALSITAPAGRNQGHHDRPPGIHRQGRGHRRLRRGIDSSGDMKLYNTLAGESQPFTPVNPQSVKMYVCGVTPYAATHVGHALSYVVFDVLRRYLEFRGYQVCHVQNFTDVDDKLIQRAQEQNIPVDELADRYIEEFFRSMDALNVQRAHVYPRATKEIGPITGTIADLMGKGYAYQVDGDVFFRVTRSKGYGKLSGRTLDGMIAGARVEVDQRKEHPMDFTLWKGAQPGEPAWDSPWGPRTPRVAHRVHLHGHHLPGGRLGHPRRRAGPDFPPSRKRDSPKRGRLRPGTLLPLLGPQRPVAVGRRQDEQVPGQPGAGR